MYIVSNIYTRIRGVYEINNNNTSTTSCSKVKPFKEDTRETENKIVLAFKCDTSIPLIQRVRRTDIFITHASTYTMRILCFNVCRSVKRSDIIWTVDTSLKLTVMYVHFYYCVDV